VGSLANPKSQTVVRSLLLLLRPYRLTSLSHLITLSARARTFGGMVRPICLALLKLITNSRVVGCCASAILRSVQFVDKIADMKTIAVTIDDDTLKLLDELTGGTSRRSRSALVRTALREFAERERRREVEAKENAVLRKHRKRLARQARALIAEQARS
jgi:Arc/MetJ-type ribon-helix-helix transcriptional regulator